MSVACFSVCYEFAPLSRTIGLQGVLQVREQQNMGQEPTTTLSRFPVNENPRDSRCFDFP